MEIYLWSGSALVLAAVAVLGRAYVQQSRRFAVLDERLSQLTAGVSLLTDTVEGGLRDVAAEIERRGAGAPVKQKKQATLQRRVSAAAKRGRSVRDIAATEQMSEGEVRLRLQMPGSAREKAHATVR